MKVQNLYPLGKNFKNVIFSTRKPPLRQHNTCNFCNIRVEMVKNRMILFGNCAENYINYHKYCLFFTCPKHLIKSPYRQSYKLSTYSLSKGREVQRTCATDPPKLFFCWACLDKVRADESTVYCTTEARIKQLI